MPKTKLPKPTDAELVQQYMDKLQHPLKAEINAVRSIIKNSSDQIKERIKWNAPSYYTTADLLTFNHRDQKRIHLVFHHEAVTKINSQLLEGDYKDRRMVYLQDMQAISHQEQELRRIIQELVLLVAAAE